MFTIENEVLRIIVQPKGAELKSIFHKQFQVEYLWSGDPAFWAKQSPVLFPIVGSLKNDTYYFNDVAYHLTRHGFARDRLFKVIDQTSAAISFQLTSDAETLAVYPFHFNLVITYTINRNTVDVHYVVTNTSNEKMYFSLGAHPAFSVPMEGAYNDYFLEFEVAEDADRWPLSPEGLILSTPEPFLRNSRTILLKKELFKQDALVFKHLHSTKISLRSTKSARGLSLDFTGFPYLGLWAARGANFVCVEPWCGIADSVETDQQFIHKEGIQQVVPGKPFERTWKLELF